MRDMLKQFAPTHNVSKYIEQMRMTLKPDLQLILCTTLFILTAFVNEAGIASPSSGRFVNSNPTQISLDQANALVNGAVPVSKDEYEHVAKYLLMKIKDQLILNEEGNGGCKAIFGKAQPYDPVHIREYNLNGDLNGNLDRRSGHSDSPEWAAPLTNDEIKSCAQLLHKLGNGSQVFATPDRVQFHLIAKRLPQGAPSQGPVLCCVYIIFGPKGFEDANYAIMSPIDRNDPAAKHITDCWPKYTQAAGKGDPSSIKHDNERADRPPQH